MLKYSVVDEMPLNQCISAGILQLLLVACVVYGSSVIDSGISLNVILIKTATLIIYSLHL